MSPIQKRLKSGRNVNFKLLPFPGIFSLQPGGSFGFGFNFVVFLFHLVHTVITRMDIDYRRRSRVTRKLFLAAGITAICLIIFRQTGYNSTSQYFSKKEPRVTHVLVTGGACYIGSHTSLRLLGKLGGRNRRFLKEPLSLEWKGNPEHGLRLILTFEPSTPFLVPLDRFINLVVSAVTSFI